MKSSKKPAWRVTFLDIHEWRDLLWLSYPVAFFCCWWLIALSEKVSPLVILERGAEPVYYWAGWALIGLGCLGTVASALASWPTRYQDQEIMMRKFRRSRASAVQN